MYAVYFLWSEKLQKVYIGSTAHLANRIAYHNAGRQRYTRKGVPWICVGYVLFPNKSMAFSEERRLKKCRNRVYYRKYLVERGIPWDNTVGKPR